MIKAFLRWVFLRRPYWHLDGYMNRWWIRKHRPGGWWSARIHQILRSDLDRHQHDHPWPYITIILAGGYWEERPDWAMKWHGPGSILIRKATDRHRLIVPDGATCWTLFIMGKWRQTWGFYTEAGKVPYTEYSSTFPAERPT